MPSQAGVIPDVDYADYSENLADGMLPFGYKLVGFIPPSHVGNGKVNTVNAFILDPYGKIENGLNATLRVSLKQADTGVILVNGAFGTRYQTYSFTTMVNTNGIGRSISAATAITSFAGIRSASRVFLVSGVIATIGSDGAVQLNGSADTYAPFFTATDGKAIDNTWAALFGSISGATTVGGGGGCPVGEVCPGGGAVASPGEYIALNVDFMTNRPLASG